MSRISGVDVDPARNLKRLGQFLEHFCDPGTGSPSADPKCMSQAGYHASERRIGRRAARTCRFSASLATVGSFLHLGRNCGRRRGSPRRRDLDFVARITKGMVVCRIVPNFGVLEISAIPKGSPRQRLESFVDLVLTFVRSARRTNSRIEAISRAGLARRSPACAVRPDRDPNPSERMVGLSLKKKLLRGKTIRTCRWLSPH